MIIAEGKEKLEIWSAGAVILFCYGIVPTFQPAHFGRVHAARGRLFIVSSATKIARGTFCLVISMIISFYRIPYCLNIIRNDTKMENCDCIIYKF